MLYDPKWEVETKADPMATATLVAWLKQQPKKGVYCYSNHGRCLFAQYFSAQGFRRVTVGGFSFGHEDSEERIWFPIGWDDVAAHKPHTFGAALKRARKLAT